MGSASLTAKDFIDKTLGGLRFMYYTYLDKFHMEPRDMEELVDGMLYLDAAAKVQREHLNNMKRQNHK